MPIDDAQPGAAASVTTNTGSPAKKLKSTTLRKQLDGARARRARDGRSSGCTVQRTCFMCRKYHLPGKAPKTSRQCPRCDTWLCNVSRVGNPHRTATCLTNIAIRNMTKFDAPLAKQKEASQNISSTAA